MRQREYGSVPVDFIFSANCASRRTEGGDLNERDNFVALAHLSLSERPLPATRTPGLLRRALSVRIDRYHGNVGDLLIDLHSGQRELAWSAGAHLVVGEMAAVREELNRNGRGS